jgi:hypothetical protein
MHFATTQRFSVEVDRALDAYLDEGFYATLATPKISSPDVLHIERADTTATVRVRYRLTADLPAAATAIIDPTKLTWVEHTEYDLVARTSRSRFEPDNYADRLQATAAATFSADGDGASTRTVEGDVKVKVRFVGGKVEDVICRDLVSHLQLEADLLDRWVTGRAAP